MKNIMKWLIITFAFYFMLYFLFIANAEETNHTIFYLYLLIFPPVVSACLVQTPFKAKMYLKSLYFYFYSGLVIIALSYVVMFYRNISDVDSIRYALSALIQGEAAIIALVVTLTLVAVQHTASSYSSRIIDIFKNHNPHLQILLFIYLTSIIYALFTLISVNREDVDAIKPHVYLAFSYGIFALLALIPYMTSTLNLLKPANIIEILADEITIDNLMSYKEKELSKLIYLNDSTTNNGEEGTKNPIQPIFDIVIKSLINYDYPTAKVGINHIGNNFSCIYESFNPSLPETRLQSLIVQDLLNNYFDHFVNISIKNNNEDVVTLIIKNLREIGFRAIKNKDFNSTDEVVMYLERVGKRVIENNYSTSLFALLIILHDMKKALPDEHSEKITQVSIKVSETAKSSELAHVVDTASQVDEMRLEVKKMFSSYSSI